MIKNLDLPKGSDGLYIMTKDAVNIIRKAVKLTVSYNKDIKSETYLEATVSSKAGNSTIEAQIRMPLNWSSLIPVNRFKATVSTNVYKNPIQAILKEDQNIVFRAYPDGLSNEILSQYKNLVFDVIYWGVSSSKREEETSGIFAFKFTTKDSIHRMIQ